MGSECTPGVVSSHSGNGFQTGPGGVFTTGVLPFLENSGAMIYGSFVYSRLLVAGPVRSCGTPGAARILF